MSWIDGGGDSMIKWDKGSCEALCNFLTHKYVPIACYECTMQILLLEKLLSSNMAPQEGLMVMLKLPMHPLVKDYA